MTREELIARLQTMSTEAKSEDVQEKACHDQIEIMKLELEEKKLEQELVIARERNKVTMVATGVTAGGILIGLAKWLISFGTAAYNEEHDRLPFSFKPGQKAIDDGLNTK